MTTPTLPELQALMPAPRALVLPWPPSINRLYRTYRGRMLLSRAGREYYADGIRTVRAQRVIPEPYRGRLSVTVLAYPPDRRKRDLDNLSKPVLDLLTKSGVWLDDSQIDALTIRRGLPEKGGRLVVTVTELEDGNG